MQFEPGTARGLGVNPADPRSGIYGAAKLLTQYGYHQNPFRAIGAYNGGPGNPQSSYATQVLSEANRLRGELAKHGNTAPVQGAQPQQASPQYGVTTTQGFDQKGFNQAQKSFKLGQFLNAQGNNGLANLETPKGASAGIRGLSSGQNPLFAAGLATTTAPNPSDYVQAHSTLQRLAGKNVPLAEHPVGQRLSASGVAAGFLPKGAPWTRGRQDQGRDGNTTPGGPIIANGSGVVLRVGSDPSGFGPSYPIVHFTSGPYAGKDMYFGHTLSVLRPGAKFSAGQVISHTGTHGIGNATVPGWVEIGFAPGGNPGPMGQPAPF